MWGRRKKRKAKKRRPQLDRQFVAIIQHSAAGLVDGEVARPHLDWAFVCGWAMSWL
jgi:hypothetical protein